MAKKRKPRSKLQKPTAADRQLSKALNHPVRAEALTRFNAGVTSPNRIAEELGVDVNLVAYHVRVLNQLNCIELVDTKKRRGATEHFYRGTARQYLDDHFWSKLSEPVRSGISVTALRVLIGAARDSVSARLFDRLKDRHVSVITYDLDEQGWKDSTGVLKETLDRLMEIGLEAETRTAEGDEAEERIRATFGLLGFESPPPSQSA